MSPMSVIGLRPTLSAREMKIPEPSKKPAKKNVLSHEIVPSDSHAKSKVLTQFYRVSS